MANISVKKVDTAAKRGLPIFEEIAKRIERVRQRAFELFLNRGQESGHAMDDWLKAEREIMGWPAGEMTEKDGLINLELTLPGFDANQIQVTATPAEIVVHAHYEKEKKEEERKVLWTEFESNDVYRQFAMPAAIDVDKVSASLDKGILRITAPKATATEARSGVAA